MMVVLRKESSPTEDAWLGPGRSKDMMIPENLRSPRGLHSEWKEEIGVDTKKDMPEEEWVRAEPLSRDHLPFDFSPHGLAHPTTFPRTFSFQGPIATQKLAISTFLFDKSDKILVPRREPT